MIGGDALRAGFGQPFYLQKEQRKETLKTRKKITNSVNNESDD